MGASPRPRAGTPVRAIPPAPVRLDGPVTALAGVGPELAARLQRLGILRVTDLLFHLPLRYEDRSRITPLAALPAGGEALVEGTVTAAETRSGARPALVCALEDGSGGTLVLRFFHHYGGYANSLRPGTRLRAWGAVRHGPYGLEMVHPECRRLGAAESAPAEGLLPVYPAVEGLSQARLRALTEQALRALAREPAQFAECLPAGVLPADWPELRPALHYLHRPPPDAPAELLSGRHPAQRRLALEELLAQHVSLRRLRTKLRAEPAPALNPPGRLAQRLLDALPYTLTAAQQRVWSELRDDLARDRPMLRLVQGDVGSGKTTVALLAALQACEAGFQVAVMAPTELLAEQHERVFGAALTALDVPVLRLAARMPPAARSAALARIAGVEPLCVVGTHALFQDQVEFGRLGLVVIDEQHRFGVHQRLALREKGRSGDTVPHQLIMTATPIPRTLAMVAYADLDLSVIDTLPPGRRPIKTVVIPEARRAEVMAALRRACGAGRQAYWVCTLVEESEALEAQAAEQTAAELMDALPELRIGLVHGRMKPDRRAAVMAEFRAGTLDLLVATTVIEVGVDVPNASLMIIDNAERLGLAQLHQLRGRVGRGAIDSSCVLLYRGEPGMLARERLTALRNSQDGFAIAQRDLELRGHGELLGVRQSGAVPLRIADLARDADLLPMVQSLADLLEQDSAACEALIARWLPQGNRYAAA